MITCMKLCISYGANFNLIVKIDLSLNIIQRCIGTVYSKPTALMSMYNYMMNTHQYSFATYSITSVNYIQLSYICELLYIYTIFLIPHCCDSALSHEHAIAGSIAPLMR